MLAIIGKDDEVIDPNGRIELFVEGELNLNFTKEYAKYPPADYGPWYFT